MILLYGDDRALSLLLRISFWEPLLDVVSSNRARRRKEKPFSVCPVLSHSTGTDSPKKIRPRGSTTSELGKEFERDFRINWLCYIHIQEHFLETIRFAISSHVVFFFFLSLEWKWEAPYSMLSLYRCDQINCINCLVKDCRDGTMVAQSRKRGKKIDGRRKTIKGGSCFWKTGGDAPTV